MASLVRLTSQVILTYWRLHRPTSTMLASMAVPHSSTRRSFLLRLPVLSFQLMIFPISDTMLMTKRSGAMCHGFASGRSPSGSFQSIVHRPWDIGCFAQFTFLVGSCCYLTAWLNNSLGGRMLRSATLVNHSHTNSCIGYHATHLLSLQRCELETGDYPSRSG